jgi:hypothetical protein
MFRVASRHGIDTTQPGLRPAEEMASLLATDRAFSSTNRRIARLSFSIDGTASPD